ncbi:glycosyltransferase domain-containing protein [Microbulbifer sp. CnH-101-E]|uniref:glycosyltransferase domain-containing protein n=1 Tax=unclassified Microbulbifer TaxID=2619833 RepID=UPI00403957BF
MLHISTIATHSERMFPVLQESARRNGVSLTILGRDHPWKDFSSKMDILLPFFQTLPEEDIICYLDGFDSLILPSVRLLEKNFHSFGKDIIFSNDYRHDGVQGYFEKKFFPNEHVFSTGIFIGKNKALQNLFQAARGMYPNYCDDQKILRRYYAHHTCEQVDIDHEAKLFYNFDMADPSYNLLNQVDHIQGGKIYLFNGQSPSIISFPCSWFAIGIKKNLHILLEKLGYDYYPEVNIKGTLNGLKYYIGTSIKESIKTLLK